MVHLHSADLNGSLASRIDRKVVNVSAVSHMGPCHMQDSYILDAGLDAGLELPYTCRGGICG